MELEAGVHADDDQFGLAPCGAGATLTLGVDTYVLSMEWPECSGRSDGHGREALLARSLLRYRELPCEGQYRIRVI